MGCGMTRSETMDEPSKVGSIGNVEVDILTAKRHQTIVTLPLPYRCC
jgi:hypothetical protein